MWAIGAERTAENPLGIYTLTPERIRLLSEEEIAARRRAAEAARGARFRELYAMLGLRAAIHADGTLEITVGGHRRSYEGGYAVRRIKLTIHHLYADMMNLYGDRGNVISIKKRCEWRSIPVEVVDVGLGESIKPTGCDLFLF